MQPHFITLEGGEGAGKSTQASLLAASFAKAGIEAVVTREPGGSAGGEAIRSLLVSGDVDRWNARSEALLFMAARYDHVETLIRPALARGAWVISDRFYDSTYVYQGIGKNVSTQWLDDLYTLLYGNFQPSLTLYFDIEPSAGIARATARGNAHEARFEAMDLAFHTRIREGFLSRALEHANRFVVMDAAQDKRIVHDSVRAAIKQKLGITLPSGSEG